MHTLMCHASKTKNYRYIDNGEKYSLRNFVTAERIWFCFGQKKKPIQMTLDAKENEVIVT